MFFVFVATCMNFYKFDIMFNLMKSGDSYPIFPWSTNPIKSKSNLIWLVIHLFTALLHVIISGVWLFTNKINCIHKMTHTLFMYAILPNIFHFGDENIFSSIILNGTVLFFAYAIYELKFSKYWKHIYFFIITLPIMFEVLKGIRII